MTLLLWLAIIWIFGPLVVACIAIVLERHDLPISAPQSPHDAEGQRVARQAEHEAWEAHKGRYGG